LVSSSKTVEVLTDTNFRTALVTAGYRRECTVSYRCCSLESL